jgi:type II secretory pathway pseudopilin PulG
MHSGDVTAQHGFAYLAMLAAMAFLGLSSAGVMQYVSHQLQREREEDLLRTGQTLVLAIEAYYLASPGSIKKLPAALEELLDDRRQVSIQRYLREIYRDPITGKSNWNVIRSPTGEVLGVRSVSSLAPIRTGAVVLPSHVSKVVIALQPATHYSDWDFVFDPASMLVPTGTSK